MPNFKVLLNNLDEVEVKNASSDSPNMEGPFLTFHMAGSPDKVLAKFRADYVISAIAQTGS